MKRKAFTLIELLVVIAIIAILAGILLPVFAQARIRAKQARSLSNIRQIGMAVQEYGADNGEAFPGWVAVGKAMVHNCWDEQIDPLVRAREVYSNGDTGIKSPSQMGATRNRVLTYALNGALIGEYQNGNINWASGPQTLTISGISNPANTILFAELATNTAPAGAMAKFANPVPGTNAPTRPSQGQSNQYADAHSQWIDIDPKAWVENTGGGARDYNPATWKPDYGVARDLYGGGGCYVFVDGHAKFQRLSVTTVGTSGLNPESNWNPASPNITYNQWYPG